MKVEIDVPVPEGYELGTPSVQDVCPEVGKHVVVRWPLHKLVRLPKAGEVWAWEPSGVLVFVLSSDPGRDAYAQAGGVYVDVSAGHLAGAARSGAIVFVRDAL